MEVYFNSYVVPASTDLAYVMFVHYILVVTPVSYR